MCLHFLYVLKEKNFFKGGHQVYKGPGRRTTFSREVFQRNTKSGSKVDLCQAWSEIKARRESGRCLQTTAPSVQEFVRNMRALSQVDTAMHHLD